MADDLVVRQGLVIPSSELKWQFSRSSGPGGQSVNTTDSRASLSFNVEQTSALPAHLRERAISCLDDRLVNGVITINAEEQRSQLQNRMAAQRRLVQLLREAIAPPPPRRRATKPSRAARERRIAGKKQRGQTKALRRNLDD